MTKITINDIEINVGHEELSDIISTLKDHEDNKELFDKMSHHESYRVRRYVANKQNISSDVALALSKDKNIEVVRYIVSNSAFKKNAELADIEQLISRGDADVCQNIVREASEFEHVEASKLFDMLSASPDPEVRLTVADTWSAPKKVLKKLLNDPDSDVKRAAKRDD
jgi:hypothetical protein